MSDRTHYKVIAFNDKGPIKKLHCECLLEAAALFDKWIEEYEEVFLWAPGENAPVKRTHSRRFRNLTLHQHDPVRAAYQ